MGSLRVFYLILGTVNIIFGQKNSAINENVYLEYKDYEHNVTGVIDSLEAPDYSVLQRSSGETNEYLLYTRSNPDIPQSLIANDANSITSSNYNSAAQTIVVVHGWGGDQKSSLNAAVRDAYLDIMDVNIIVLDWSRVSTSNYVTASLGVLGVGGALGQFLTFLRNTAGSSFGNMHLVGFSLGAHVVGNAGRFLGGQVARITGLDPAGPLWGPLNLNRLTKSNGIYVEAIHTDRGVLGTVVTSGDADFYPNDGSSQPGCQTDSCSHQRAWQLFAATVTYDHLIGRECTDEVTLGQGLCSGGYLRMGNSDINKTGSGMYWLKTDGVYPYNQIY